MPRVDISEQRSLVIHTTAAVLEREVIKYSLTNRADNRGTGSVESSLSKSRWTSLGIHMHLRHPLSSIDNNPVLHHHITLRWNQKLQVLDQMWEENREHIFRAIQRKRLTSNQFDLRWLRT